jgi:hypothetical protein
MTAATEACARCGRSDARLTLTSRGRLCPSCREELVAANREAAAATEPASSDWRATRVTELTGVQLATAIAWGVVKGFGIWAVIGAVVALVVAIFARS